MGMLVLGLVLFLGVHSIAIVAPRFRDRALARLGEGGWKGLYAVVSLAGFVLLIVGFGQARHAPVVLYTPAPFLRHVTFLFMLPVFPLIFAAYLPGRIKTAMKHPMLAAVKFWAFAHLLSNGMLADVLLFGGFLVWAVLDRISLKRRPPQALRTAPSGPFNDVIAVVLGLAVYGAFIGALHRWLIGVSPLG
jgi:uncharacterized membrane protein